MGDMTVSGRLPGGDGNGLVAIQADLISQGLGETRPKLHLCIALVDCAKVTTNGDTHETLPVARVRRIEVVADEGDARVLQAIMRRALDRRSGREALPYDLDDELRQVLDAEAEQDRIAQQEAANEAKARAADDPSGGPPLDPGSTDQGDAGSQPEDAPDSGDGSGGELPGQQALPLDAGDDDDVDTRNWPDDPSGLIRNEGDSDDDDTGQ